VLLAMKLLVALMVAYVEGLAWTCVVCVVCIAISVDREEVKYNTAV